MSDSIKRINILMDIFPEYKEDPSVLIEDFKCWVIENRSELIEEKTESMVDLISLSEQLQSACADEVVRVMLG